MEHQIQIAKISECSFDYDCEIPQENNLNANSKLWIQSDCTVFKQYVIWNDQTSKNIHNLLLLSRNPTIQKMPEIVTPLKLIKHGDAVIGFTMPYIKGVDLNTFLQDKFIPDNKKMDVFLQLAHVISAMPRFVSIGDLHEGNVLVDSNCKIHLIDIDGFSVFPRYSLTCPLTYLVQYSSFLSSAKYRHIFGSLKIGKNTDIFCFIRLLVKWLMGNIDFLTYTLFEFTRYLSYLESVDFPIAVLKMIRRIYHIGPNYIDISALGKIRPELLSLYSYNSFLRTVQKQ